MPVSHPIPVQLPAHGVALAESVHAAGFRMADRTDPFHKVIYVLHGRVLFSGPESKQPIQGSAGSVFCVAAGTRHRIEDAIASTLLLLCFSERFLTRTPGMSALWRGLSGETASALMPGRAWSHRFEGSWRAALVEQTGAQPGHEALIAAAAAQILVSLARLPRRASTDEARRRVEAVAREMAETFYEPWSLERACARAAMSRRHFSNLFRSVTGQTFLESLTELRITHAAELLRAGRHSVLGAAFSSGYGDLSHFYRLFRARHGHPPAAWAARAARGSGSRPAR